MGVPIESIPLAQAAGLTPAPDPASYSANTRWYLEVNQLARQTPWAHGFMATYSHFLGIGLLALVLLGAWWAARSAVQPARAVAGVLWAAAGTVVAWLLAHEVLKPLVAERRPYLALAHVEVLLGRTHGYSFPSGHATVAGAVIVGLFLARRYVAAWVATLLGLFLAFGRIYTGMHYPFDVLGGLAFGGAVVAVLWPVALRTLTRFDEALLPTPLGWFVAADPAERTEHLPPSPSPRVGGQAREASGAGRPAGGRTRQVGGQTPEVSGSGTRMVGGQGEAGSAGAGAAGSPLRSGSS